MSADPTAIVIAGRTVTLPVEVRDASAGTATYLVDAHTARRLLPGEELDLVELLPGRALLSLGCIDYRDNDLGAYHELSIALVVRERGRPQGVPVVGPLVDVARGRLATYIHRLPVDEAFSCEAGRRIWGFPKTVDRVEIQKGPDRTTCDWTADGRPVLRFSVHRRGTRKLPDRTLATYTWIDGSLHRTTFSSGAEGAGFRLGGAELALGTHPIADELRALGLPRRALLSGWMERMRGRFEAPVKL